MMLRVIPKLDIKGSNLVKGVGFEGLRVLGKPREFARHYYQNGADELIFHDVIASLLGRNTLYDVISEAAKDIFIPITVGGGVSTLEGVKKLLHVGADKVSINTAGIKNPQLLKDMVNQFGSSTIVGQVRLGPVLIIMVIGKRYIMLLDGFLILY